MPESSHFLVIVITMYFDDHNSPRFHAPCEEYGANVGIEPLEPREGRLPPRVPGLGLEWGEMRQAELMEHWTTLDEEGSFRRVGLVDRVRTRAGVPVRASDGPRGRLDVSVFLAARQMRASRLGPARESSSTGIFDLP